MATRDECYGRIRECMKLALRHYYEHYPERLFDERGTEAVKVSLDGLDAILKILDDFEIEQRVATQPPTKDAS